MSLSYANTANKRYVQQSVQDLKDRPNKIERKSVAIQDIVQVMLNELEKIIREVHRAEQLSAMSEEHLLVNELHAPARRNFPRRHVIVHGYL